MTRRSSWLKTGTLWSIRREDLLEARPMQEAEETIAREAKGMRSDEREKTAHRSKDERKRREETLAKPSVAEDWQEMVAPDPSFYLKDNG
jgi:hypothetical protein